ncbi:hypothetical protein CERSUDRAFT_78365 [Gelatoporia subvermispora B]|uniref:DUF6533 domain-containing protein n=1 Tax=Ceriporiopsis subvermispora (strain B) TaxID=914234 RepID=M2QZ48_CERS8|nr:hypothetical protein CERSUDRAFT_78365 [Gelatoporia subvermispora B]
MHVSSGFAEKELRQDYIYSLCPFATCTIVLHEYVATFDMELEVLWSRKITNIPSILFLLNRYGTIIQALWIVSLSFISIEDEVLVLEAVHDCFGSVMPHIVLHLGCISSRNSRLGITALMLGLVPFCTNLERSQLTNSFQRKQYGTCAQLSALDWLDEICLQTWNPATIKNDIRKDISHSVVFTHASLILCDMLVLWVTLSSTFSTRRPASSSEPRVSIWKLLVRDACKLVYGSQGSVQNLDAAMSCTEERI